MDIDIKPEESGKKVVQNDTSFHIFLGVLGFFSISICIISYLVFHTVVYKDIKNYKVTNVRLVESARGSFLVADLDASISDYDLTYNFKNLPRDFENVCISNNIKENDIVAGTLNDDGIWFICDYKFVKVNK